MKQRETGEIAKCMARAKVAVLLISLIGEKTEHQATGWKFECKFDKTGKWIALQ